MQNAVVTLIDRLVHKAEILQLPAEGSYRFKVVTERQDRRSSRKK